MKITRTITINQVEFIDIKDGKTFDDVAVYYGNLENDKIVKLHLKAHPNTLVKEINTSIANVSWDVEDIIKYATFENEGDNE